jgi:hypothetical protein
MKNNALQEECEADLIRNDSIGYLKRVPEENGFMTIDDCVRRKV